MCCGVQGTVMGGDVLKRINRVCIQNMNDVDVLLMPVG